MSSSQSSFALSEGYAWEQHEADSVILSSAFNSCINQRDNFLGQKRCIICGLVSDMVLQHCHIIEGRETWVLLKYNSWIPFQTQRYPQHEPRNGLLLCSNHYLWFENYFFFLRFLPNIQKYVFVNYSGDAELQKYHGKAVAIDIKDRYAPFPSLFLFHEMRCRGFHPFSPLNPTMPGDSPWQEWIELDGVFDHLSGSFKRNNTPDNSDNGCVTVPPLRQCLPPADSASSGEHPLEPLNKDVITEILTATRAMSSWKACEESRWSGTAEENIEKYISTIHKWR